jgi:hypothetical protein
MNHNAVRTLQRDCFDLVQLEVIFFLIQQFQKVLFKFKLSGPLKLDAVLEKVIGWPPCLLSHQNFKEYPWNSFCEAACRGNLKSLIYLYFCIIIHQIHSF